MVFLNCAKLKSWMRVVPWNAALTMSDGVMRNADDVPALSTLLLSMADVPVLDAGTDTEAPSPTPHCLGCVW